MAGIPRISMHYQCDFATGASGSLNAQFPLPTSAPAARRFRRRRQQQPDGIYSVPGISRPRRTPFILEFRIVGFADNVLALVHKFLVA